MCQSAVSPLSFFKVKAKMVPPFLMASFRSASSASAEEMRSKAAEEGKASVVYQHWCLDTRSKQTKERPTVLERHLDE